MTSPTGRQFGSPHHVRGDHVLAAIRGIGGVAMPRVGLAVVGGLGALGWLVLTPSVTVATHGSAGLPAVVESERIANGSAPGTCRVAGVVQNSSLSETVTARLSWRGLDATGAPVAAAFARIPWLRPGERRPFTSSPFVATTGGVLICERIAHVERLDTIAEPVPLP